MPARSARSVCIGVCVGAALWIAGSCHRRTAGVEGGAIVRDRGRIAGERAEGREGDYYLKNDRVALVVAARAAPWGHRAWTGGIRDLAPVPETGDHLGGVHPALGIGHERPQILTASSVVPLGDGAGVRTVSRGGPAGQIEVVTEIRLAQREPFVRLVSRATNHLAVPVSVRLADSVYWGNAPAFVPGQGRLSAEQVLRVPWFARARGGVAYLWAPDGEASIETRFTGLSIAGDRFFGEILPSAPPVQLAPGASTAFSRKVFAVAGDVAAAAVAWARTRRTERAGVTVRFGGAGPRSFAVRDTEGRVQIEGEAQGGVARTIALDAGDYRVEVRSLGVRPTEQAIRVPFDGTVEIAAPPSATLVAAVRDRSTGEPLPARVLVRALDPGGPDPEFAAEPGASGPRYALCTIDGETTTPISPGRYRVIATRGIEYTIDERIVELAPGAAVRVDLRIERVVDTRGWISADLHLHAAPSPDSFVSLEERVASLACAGVEVGVATDHNRVTDYAPAIRRLGLDRWLSSIVGDEVTTSGTRRFGHFNAFPLRRKPDEPAEGAVPYHDIEPRAIFDLARGSGARILQVNHPRMAPQLGYFDLVDLDAVTAQTADPAYDPRYDAIEVFNGLWLSDVRLVERDLIDYHHLLDAGYRYAATGNSDSHKLLYEEAGFPRNFVRVPDDPATLDVAGFCDAIRAAHVIVTNGPFVRIDISGAGPGDTASIPSGATQLSAHVAVLAPDWIAVDEIELVGAAGIVAHAELLPGASRGAARFAGTLAFAAPPLPSWVMAVVRGRQPLPDVLPQPNVLPFAFTDPVWLEPAAATPETGAPATGRGPPGNQRLRPPPAPWHNRRSEAQTRAQEQSPPQPP